MAAPPRLLDRNDTALLVIDVQERIDGVMADQSHRPRLAVLVDACRTLEVPIVATEQNPKGIGPTVDDLATLLPDSAIVKMTFSCAREPEARQAVRATERRQILVTGIEAHVCVLQTAIDLLGEGLEVHVPHDAVNSRRPTDKRWALHRMAAAGAIITSTESALFELLERCGTDDFKAVSKLVKQLPVEASGWHKLWKGLGLVVLIYGALFLVGLAAGGKDTLQPLRGVVVGGGAAEQHLAFKRIKTIEDLQAELDAAQASGRPVMLDFYADWCVYCIQMEKNTFPDPAVQAALGDAVLLQADVTAQDEADKALQQHIGIPAPPAMIFWGADGQERRNYRLLGYMGPEDFAVHVQGAFQ